MLRNPHVVTERSSFTDLVLDERSASNIGILSTALTASEDGVASSVEKAFVNLRFNDLSTSVSAGDSLFLSKLSLQWHFIDAFNLSHPRTRETVYETSNGFIATKPGLLPRPDRPRQVTTRVLTSIAGLTNDRYELAQATNELCGRHNLIRTE
tara:strand:- start:7308 stop:7766 length:459 start_codon:yes stop_codon:yes gene_type:complete